MPVRGLVSHTKTEIKIRETFRMSFNLRRFLKNIGYLYGVNILGSIILFFQGVILIRYLGSENYGMWSLARSLPAMIYILADLGINSVILREIAHQPTRETIRKHFANTLFIKIFLSFIFLSVVALLTLLLDYSHEVIILIFLSTFSYVAITFAEVVIILFKARENFKWQAAYSFLQTLGIFLIVVITVWLKLDILIILASITLYQIGLFAVFFLLAIRRYPLDWRVIQPVGYQLRLIKRAFPFALIGVMSNFFYEVDTVMLSKLGSFSDVGIFNAANRLIHAMLMFPLFFGQVLFPTFSYLFKNRFDEFLRLVIRFEKFVILLAFPVAFLFFRFAEPIILLLFSDKYAGSIAPLQILTFSLLFYFLSVSFTTSLNAGHLEKKVALTISLAALIKVALNFLLIPRYLAVGASFGVVAGEMTLAAGSFYFFMRQFHYRLRLKSAGRFAFALSPLLIFFFSIKGPMGYLVYLFALLLYVLLVFRTGLLSFQEFRQFREKLRQDDADEPKRGGDSP